MRNTQGFPPDPRPIGWDVDKKMETISDLHFQCSLRGSNPRPQH